MNFIQKYKQKLKIALQDTLLNCNEFIPSFKEFPFSKSPLHLKESGYEIEKTYF